jgi:hypothetical protein
MKLHAPQPLTADHQLNTFNCGETSLDEWLKRRALLNQSNGASRTFVVVDESQLVMAITLWLQVRCTTKTPRGPFDKTCLIPYL